MTVDRPRETAGLPYGVPTGCPRQENICGTEHIFNENYVARGGIINENVCHRATELAAGNDKPRRMPSDAVDCEHFAPCVYGGHYPLARVGLGS